MTISYQQLDMHATKSNENPSYLTTLLRNLRLHILQQISPLSFKRERPKVAIFRDRGVASLHIILHILPFVAATSLIVLNLVTYHVGDVSSVTLTTIQFAAKFMEMLMQVSLTTILLALIRHQMLVSQQPVAFGGLLAPYRITSLSYLWSLEFWGATTSLVPWTGFKFAFCALVPLFVSLATLVGPSSAILMIPRIGQYPSANRISYMGPSDTLFPRTFDLADVVDTNATGRARVLIAEQDFNYTIRSLYGAGSRDLRLPITDLVSDQGSRLLITKFSLTTGQVGASLGISATIPTQLVLRIFEDQWRFGDTESTWVQTSHQPYVYLRCWSFNECPTDGKFIQFSPGDSELNEIIPASSLSDTTNQDRTVSQLYADVSIEKANTTTVWASPPDDSAIFVTTSKDESLGKSAKCPFACSVKALWVNTDTRVRNSLNLENEDPSNLMFGTDNSFEVKLSSELLMRMDKITRATLPLTEKERNISIPDSLLQSIAPAIALMMSSSSTIPNSMLLPKSANSSGSGFWLHTPNTYLENDKSWLRHDQNTYNDAYAFFDTKSVVNRSTIGVVESRGFYDNYRYNSEDMTVKLSLAVMFIYALIVFIYLGYSLFTGYTATSWDSIADLVTLALNSRQPDGFDNTSVGVQTLGIFRKAVRLRVAEGEACELVFSGQDAAKGKSLKDVEPNHAY